MKKLAIAFLFLSLTTTESHAVVQIKGVGAMSCGTWTKDAKSDPRGTSFNLSWVLGSLSMAAQLLDKDVLREIEAEAIEGAMTKYCAENPLDSINEAGFAVFKQLVSKKGLK